MEAYLKQLIAIQQQVNGLVEEIQSHMLREKIGAGPPAEGPKKRGRPPKAVAVVEPAGEPEKPKRVLSDEHKQKLREGRERAKAARDAEKEAAVLAAAEKALEEAASAPVEAPVEAPVATSIAVVEEKEAPIEHNEVNDDAASVATAEVKPKKRIILRKTAAKQTDADAQKPTEADIYKYMFDLQESGVCNMLGSGEYLRKRFSGMTAKEADDIVLNYMSNYDELHAKYA